MEYEQNMITKDWDDNTLNLSKNILRGIYAYGFETPSAIQSVSIPYISQGKDIIAVANSGTGKTGSYLIGVFSHINEALNKLQCVILSPTRELALQIYKVAQELAKYTTIKLQLLVGGTDTQNDIVNIKNTTPHVVVGCTGRIYDIFTRDILDTLFTKMLVLDEADEMLSTGFHVYVQNIFKYLPIDVQVILFSATMTDNVLSLTKQFMHNPVHINLNHEVLSFHEIQQYKVISRNDCEKYTILKDVFNTICFSQCIIYCNHVVRVCDLYEAMKDDEFSVTYIHSNMTKTERNDKFVSFINGDDRILISTNLTARGIDIQQVSTVINFDLPKTKETYVHRIGRSGRWGRKGLSISFCTMREIQFMKQIEEAYEIDIPDLPTDLNAYFV